MVNEFWYSDLNNDVALKDLHARLCALKDHPLAHGHLKEFDAVLEIIHLIASEVHRRS